MRKSAPLDQLIQFNLHDDCVESGGLFFRFYRYYPPNTDIMTEDEVAQEIENLSSLFDSIDRAFAMFSTDKIEDMSRIRKYYASLDPRFDAYTSEIIAQIDSAEENSASVQRAFYFIISSKNRTDDIYNQLVGRGYHIQPAEKDEIITMLRNYYIREFVTCDIHTLENDLMQDKRIAKQLAKRPELLGRELEKRLLPHRIDFHVSHAVCNETLRKVYMVKNLTQEIAPQALLKAATIKGSSFMMRMTPMMANEVKRMVDTQMRNSRVKLGGRQITEQIEAVSQSNALTDFYRSISTNRSQVYYTSIYFELYGHSAEDLNRKKMQLIEALPTGITLESLPREQKDAFSSVQPLGRDLFLSDANNLPSRSAAALYPFSYSCRMDEHGIAVGTTQRGGPFYLDMLRRTSDVTNSNFGIIGAAGQGKSTLMKKLIEFLTMMGVSCFTLDPENEYGDLFRNLGGTVYKCVDGRSVINPLEVRWLYREDEDAQDEEDTLSKELQNTSMFFQHLSWLKDFFRILFPGISDLDTQALMVLVQEMYAAHGVNTETDFSKFTPADYPTLSDLYQYIEHYDTEKSRIIAPDVIARLLLRLKECYDGPLSLIFNGHTNVKNANMICFEAAELMEGSKDRTQAVLFNICTWIWTQVMKRDRKIAFNLDELYLFLENMTMVKYINSFAKRSRKYGAMLGISTQQLADCLRPDIATYTTALFNNAAFKFLFHPGTLDMDLVQDKLKLTKGEINRISFPNRGYCLVKVGIDRYYVHVEMLPYEKELFGTGGGQ